MIRLAVRAPADRAELVLAELLELAPAGVEEIDGAAITEFAIYGAPGEIPDLGEVAAVVGGVEVEVRSREVGDDWAERWKEFHRPVIVADRVCVRPPWTSALAGLEDIVIDPGRAFGTAAHPTTRLCCELLIDAAARGEARGALTDLGAGSGVLAILAARLGWDPVIAVDHELAAIEAAAANAEANGAEIETRRLDLRRDPPPPAPTVVANLTLDLLIGLAEAYGATTATPERFVASGIIEEQVAELVARFELAGLVVDRSLVDSGWSALLLRTLS